MAVHTCKICWGEFYTRTNWGYCSNRCYQVYFKKQAKIDSKKYRKTLDYIMIDGVRYNKEDIKRLVSPIDFTSKDIWWN